MNEHEKIPSTKGYSDQNGLTKREYFAALAMQGILSNTDPSFITMSVQKVGILATAYADALLLELEK